MVRHIVAWNYKEGFTDEQNLDNAKRIKSELENLKKSIEGIVELNVYINTMPSGDRDIVLNSLFENEEALAAYQIHPKHKNVGVFINTVATNRICVDYYE